MASAPLIDVLLSLQSRIKECDSEFLKLREKIQSLEDENLWMRNQIKEKNAEILHLQADIEYLKVSYRVAEHPETIREARLKIAGLIKTIDNCISMLKENDDDC